MWFWEVPEAPELLEAEPGPEESRDLWPQPSIGVLPVVTDHHGLCHVYLSWAVPTPAHDSPGRLVPRLSRRTRKPELGKGEHLAHSVNPCVQCGRLLGGRTPGNQACFGNPVSYSIPSRSMSQEHGNQKGT